MLNTFARWQNHRPVWLIMAFTALFLELLAWLVFQEIQGYEACELCVYIRFSMLVIFAGGMIAAIRPKSLIFRAIAYVVCGYGIIKGWIWDIKLQMEHIMLDKLESGMDFFAAGGGRGGCSMEPVFPFGLPLNEWFPSNFQPTGVCGADGWSMLGFNMSECLFLFYGIYTIALILGIIATVNSRKRST